MFYKRARVEYVPLGVVGAIVPWNYPFHNIFNPLTAALFAGNACVIKVGGQAASWLAVVGRCGVWSSRRELAASNGLMLLMAHFFTLGAREHTHLPAGV